MSKKIIVVGAFHEVIELAENNGFEIMGLIDNKKTGEFLGYEIIGNDTDADSLSRQYPLIITPDKPELRLTLYNYYNGLGYKFGKIISNDAKISSSAIVMEGTLIQNGVNASSECRIGKFVKLNTNCNIMHNSVVADFTTVAPSAVILGNVKIGKFCYIGANATILPNIEICDKVVIGAGSVVTENVSLPSTLVGVPARLLKS